MARGRARWCGCGHRATHREPKNIRMEKRPSLLCDLHAKEFDAARARDEILAKSRSSPDWPPYPAGVRSIPLQRPRATPEPEKLGEDGEIGRLEKERAEWQETAEAYCDHAGRRFDLLKRIHAACGRAISGDHDKKSMLDTLQLCASMAADETKPRAAPTTKVGED